MLVFALIERTQSVKRHEPYFSGLNLTHWTWDDIIKRSGAQKTGWWTNLGFPSVAKEVFVALRRRQRAATE